MSIRPKLVFPFEKLVFFPRTWGFLVQLVDPPRILEASSPPEHNQSDRRWLTSGDTPAPRLVVSSEVHHLNKIFLILASSSPRRKKLLEAAGYRFEVDPSNFSEPDPTPGVAVAEYVADLAWRKARDVAIRRGTGLILAADTSCAAGGEILNKPVDRADAERMLRLQEGTETEVVTGVCLYRADQGVWLGFADRNVCRCRVLTDAERTRYLDSGNWRGKAGAYGLQDDDPFVTVTSGSWSSVVGLPIERLATVFTNFPHLTASRD